MGRFDELISTAEEHQALAAENYDRIRRLAEQLRDGFCDYLDAKDGVCVRLVPPMGPFQPKAYGDEAFSVPKHGFRPLGPVSFGLAIRVSRGTDWIRLTMVCSKLGEDFRVSIMGGPEYRFHLPLASNESEPFYDMIFDHVRGTFAEQSERYKHGEYSQREIGFDFADDEDAASV